MAITRAALRKIIEIVAADPECQSRIEDWRYTGSMALDRDLLSHMGWTGTDRNMGYALVDGFTGPIGGFVNRAGQRLASRGLSDSPFASARNKVGGALEKAGKSIAVSFASNEDEWVGSVGRLVCTGIAAAVDAALKSARASKEIPGFASARTIDRNVPFSHTANGVTMTDGTQYALDWWKSLDIHAPFVSTHADWMASKRGWQYSEQGSSPNPINVVLDDPAPTVDK